MLSPMLAHSY